MKITLVNGYVEVPNDSTIVNLSDGKAEDVGVIADKKGVLPPLVVVSNKSVRGLSATKEEKLVDAAIKNMPSYVEARAEELPYPDSDASKEEWNRWNASFRLGFFPIALITGPHSKYKLYEGGKHEKKAKCLGNHLFYRTPMGFHHRYSRDLH